MLYITAGNQVEILQVNSSTGAVGTPTATSLRQGASAASIAADSQSKFLFVADNRSDTATGSVHVLSVDPASGNLNEVSGSPFFAGTTAGIGQGAVGQLAIDPTGHFLYLGTGGSPAREIEGFTLDRATGALTSIGFFGNFGTNGISGLLVHPSGKFVYATDQNGHVLGFAVNSTTGALTALPGSPFPVVNATADIVLTPSGIFLFALVKFTSTGENGFEVWKVDSTTGALTEIGASPVASPDIASAPLLMDPGGKFLYTVAIGAGIEPYAINSTTGQLSPKGVSRITFPFAILESASIDSQGKLMFMSGSKSDALAGVMINLSTGAPTPVGAGTALSFFPGPMIMVKLP